MPWPLKAGAKKGAGALSVAPGRSSCLFVSSTAFEQVAAPPFQAPKRCSSTSAAHRNTTQHGRTLLSRNVPHPAPRVPRESPNRYPAQRVRIRKGRGPSSVGIGMFLFLAPTLLRTEQTSIHSHEFERVGTRLRLKALPNCATVVVTACTASRH